MSFFIRKGGEAGRNVSAQKRKMSQGQKKGKKIKKIDDEEIDSDGSDIEGREDVGYESEEDLETAEEKKLRLAKLYLQEIEKELEERGEDDRGGTGGGVEERLKEEVEAEKGKLRKEITSTLNFDQIEHTMLQDKHHKQSITCLVVSHNNKHLYTASKDKGLVKWELQTGKKLFKIKGGDRGSETVSVGHCHCITCLSVTEDDKYLASGDTNKLIYVWNCDNMTRMHIFKGHRQEISGLAFRRGTHTLYSSSYDRSVKIWSVDERSYVETMYGHQDRVTAIDAGSRERAVSAGGRDKTVRVWKIVEESQLVFNLPTYSVDCVKLLNEEHWVTAGEDGHLAVWGATKKKPLCIVQESHGRDPVNSEPYWISALATLYNTDMVATGSRDGAIRIWSVGHGFRSITQVNTIQVDGFVNSLSINLTGSLVVAGVGQEHRLGRWWTIKTVKNRIHQFKIKAVE
eukprot:TRINITY_DN18347_c0_g1_i1.p1 TRINITY_DN18347_c0_g1~~TRINITY_DN18347_c0_g1_i1.p1  ORF type:complete len:458 (-),score=116.51 TRINITY_DN18347_c0_g1_i1:400-1773(-)